MKQISDKILWSVIFLTTIVIGFKFIQMKKKAEQCRSTLREYTEKDFEILKELSDSIGNKNIIILSKYSNLKDAKIYYNNLDFPFNYYNYQFDLEVPIEKNVDDVPCFFILEPSLEAIFPYISKPSHSIKSAYFQRIIKYYLH